MFLIGFILLEHYLEVLSLGNLIYPALITYLNIDDTLPMLRGLL
jgi:hypothetical protein